ncbi:MAG: hypothetical protein IKV53_00165 [Clostridia bacterium]|nr:hypothetical protein [Clostridia bacterium]
MYKLTVKLEKFHFCYGIKSKSKRFDRLSRDRYAVQRLCDLCNGLKLDEVHIEDVIEDFLTDSSNVKEFSSKR